MKLYYSPGACSLAPHIVLRELELPAELVRVDLKRKRLEDGTDFETINPKGSVPAIEIGEGRILTEASVILRYLADQNPTAKLSVEKGEPEYYRFLEWLNYIATELHKGFGPLLHEAPESFKMATREKMNHKLEFLSEHLKGRKYLMGDAYTIADAYLFTILTWCPKAKIIFCWPDVFSFAERVKSRPATKDAFAEEGLS